MPRPCEGSVARKGLDLGLRRYGRAELEAHARPGCRSHIRVLGLASIAPDVTPELARAAIASVEVLGTASGEPGRARRPSPTAFAEPPSSDWTCTHERYPSGRHGRGDPPDPRRTAGRGNGIDPAPAARPRGAHRPASPAPHVPATPPTFASTGLLGRAPAGTDAGATGGALPPPASPVPPGSRAYQPLHPQRCGPARRCRWSSCCTAAPRSPDDFAAGTRMNVLAEEQGFFVAYPEQDAARQRPAVLELVPARRPAARPRRARADRRHHRARSCASTASTRRASMSPACPPVARRRRSWPQPTPTCSPRSGVHSGLACGAARDLPSALAAMQQGPHGCARPPLVPGCRRSCSTATSDRTVNPPTATRLAQALAGRRACAPRSSEGAARGASPTSRPPSGRVGQTAAGALDRPWRRPRLVRRQPRRQLHRPARPRRLARHGRVLPGAPNWRRGLMSAAGTHAAHAR